MVLGVVAEMKKLDVGPNGYVLKAVNGQVKWVPLDDQIDKDTVTLTKYVETLHEKDRVDSQNATTCLVLVVFFIAVVCIVRSAK